MLQLKLCCQCRAACESAITECPRCNGQIFRDTSVEELIKITPGDKIRVYFLKWPDWPNESVWHNTSNLKGGLERPSSGTFLRKLLRRFFEKKKSRQ